MPKKFMNDFQRVTAGNWIERQKTWIETEPTTASIVEAAEKELGHRVTESFVRAYLPETEWFHRARTRRRENLAGDKVEEAVAITLDILVEVFRNPDYSSGLALEGIERARDILRSKDAKMRQLDLITEAQMKAGHA